MPSYYDKKGVITADDSNLQKSIRKVLQEDHRREQARRKSDFEHRRASRDLSVNETAASIIAEDEQSDIASQSSLRNYPGSNRGTGTEEYPRPNVANAHRYYGDRESLAPKIEPNVGN